jgi:hypothetical protein
VLVCAFSGCIKQVTRHTPVLELVQMTPIIDHARNRLHAVGISSFAPPAKCRAVPTLTTVLLLPLFLPNTLRLQTASCSPPQMHGRVALLRCPLLKRDRCRRCRSTHITRGRTPARASSLGTRQLHGMRLWTSSRPRPRKTTNIRPMGMSPLFLEAHPLLSETDWPPRRMYHCMLYVFINYRIA